jgi:putative ABC transport system permease protein
MNLHYAVLICRSGGTDKRHWIAASYRKILYVLEEMILEGQLLTLIGVCLGLLIGHSGSYLLSDVIFSYPGIQIYPWTPIFSEMYIFIVSIVIVTLATLWPALRSYRVQPLELFKS